MEAVYIVYIHFPEGEKYALKAYASLKKAQDHLGKLNRPLYDDPYSSTPASIIGVSAVTISAIPIEK